MTEDEIPSLDSSAETIRMYARDNGIGIMEAKHILRRKALIDVISRAETLDDLKTAMLQMIKYG